MERCLVNGKKGLTIAGEKNKLCLKNRSNQTIVPASVRKTRNDLLPGMGSQFVSAATTVQDVANSTFLYLALSEMR